MTEATFVPMRSEGWLSPKVVIGLGLLLLVVGLSASCLLITAPGGDPAAPHAIAGFSDITGLLKLLVVEVLAPLFVALGLDKHAQAKAGVISPLPTDGWGSRKIIIGVPMLLLFVVGSYVAMLLESPAGGAPIATFAQFASFLQTIVPSILLPLFGALQIDQYSQAALAAKAQ